MSGWSDDQISEDRTVLAGEYVLGTLPADERVRVAQELPQDPLLADAVADWERRLAPLAASVPALAPPAALWRRIERSAYAAAVLPHDRRGRSGGMRVALLPGPAAWKGATAASLLLAAGIAFAALTTRAPAPVPVATLSPVGGAETGFVVEARRDGTLLVLPLHPVSVPAGHDLELWSLARGDAPRPLGVLPSGGRSLRSGVLPRGAVQILVSLEPAGGSPTGLPTGPVLYGGIVSMPD